MEKAIIITAPSGAGKSTIAAHILQSIDNLGFSVSATTRPQRDGETDGEDYYFISEKEFRKHVENNDFVEWEEVYEGIFYGTLKAEVERIWNTGRAVLYIVDVVGAKDLKGYFGEKALAIFIEPPSLDILKERLLSRGTETDKTLARRLERAEREMKEKDDFDLAILNDDLELAKIQAEDEVRYFLEQD